MYYVGNFSKALKEGTSLLLEFVKREYIPLKR
jgi:hypothetical protein